MPHSSWILIALVVVVIGFSAAFSRRRSEPHNFPAPPGPAASQEEIDEAISDWVTQRVREGFETREEIVEFVTDNIQDEYDLSDAPTRVAEETDRRLKEHLRSQSSWPETTDCDRIDQAFADLEAIGIVARQNFACCQNRGNAEIGDEIDAFAKKKAPNGYTFYHMQDTEGACENGSLYLAYGTVKGTEKDAATIGETIRDTLGKNGLNVEWNRQLDRRICVTGLDWKRRRNPE